MRALEEGKRPADATAEVVAIRNAPRTGDHETILWRDRSGLAVVEVWPPMKE